MRRHSIPPFAAALLTVFLFAFAAGCEKKASAPQTPPPKVTVQHPTEREVTDYLEFTGNTRAVESVDLRARVQGYLRSINFRDGSIVRKGSVLFEIEPETYQANLQQAQASLATAQTNLTRSETELSRSQKLLSAKAGPETDVTQWVQQRDSARAAIENAKAQIEIAKLNLSYTRVTAPFDGRISRRLVDPGNLVGAGEQTVLATLIRLDPIYAYFTLNERDYLRLIHTPGLSPAKQPKPSDMPPLEMGLSDQQGYAFKGHLDYSDLGVDATTGTILLRGVFPNPDMTVVPGLFVRIRAPLKAHQAIVVPETAVSINQQGNVVLTVDANNIVQQKVITVGQSVDGQRVVESGLTLDDRVIVSGIQLARPGNPVTPVDAAEQGQPAQQQGQPAKADAQKS